MPHDADRAPGDRTATDFERAEYPAPIRLLAGRAHYEVVIAALAQTRRTLWIATANVKDLMIEDVRARPGVRRTLGNRRARGQYRSIVELFEELVDRGVEIRLLHAAEPSRIFRARLAARPHLRKPRARGSFEMRQCPRVHLKAVVVDGEQVYLGSANFTGAGLGARGEGKRNFELGLMSRDDQLLDQVQSLFEDIWSGGPCGACKLRGICPAPIDGGRGLPAAAGATVSRSGRRSARPGRR